LSDVNAEIGVSIDTSGALGQLKSLQREIARFHSSVAKSSEAASLAQRDLQRNFLNGVNAIKGFSAELRTVRTTAENFTDSLEKNKFSMREYFRYSAASTRTFGRFFKSELDTVNKVAVENVKRLQTQYIKMGRDASGAMRAIAVMPTNLDMNNLATQTQLAAQKQAIFNQLIKQGSTNLLNFGKNTQWAGRQLMVGFTIPLVGLGSVATKTFMDMETAAIKFRKVYGDLFTPTEQTQFALESIQGLGKEFTKYGIAVADTVSLAADAAAAGFQGQDLQAQVSQATRLQVLGQIDQQKALETTISLTNAFKIQANDLADTINFLNAVENQTVVSLDDITTAIPKAAPIVQELGGDVKDLAFFMAAMKEGGINAAEGANALKSGLASLINPSNKAKGMLMDMGINIDQIVEKNVGNLKATVIEFAQALDNLSGLQRQRAIEQLFGKFQQARLSALFDNVIKDGNQASRVLDLAGASVEDLASLAEKELGITANSSMNKFRKAVEDLRFSLVPVGQAFLEVLTPLLDKLNTFLDWFNGLSDGTKKVITKIVLYLGGLAPVLLMTIGLMANFVANGIKGLMLLRTGFLRLTGQSKILGEQTNYLTVEQQNAVAAAASLEQSHMRLEQAFTGEAGAVRQLVTEYQRMINAQNTAATRMPGMMVPGFRPKKFAEGVVSVPGPKGAGDIVPAMVSPGEAIIPAKMAQKYGGLINGMISDTIPGYRKGLSLNIERAHATMPFAQGSPEFESIFTLIPELRELNKQFPGIIRVVSNLTAELPTSLNQAIKEITLKSGKISGGVSIPRFESEYGSLKDKFAASAMRGGADISNPRILAATRKLEVAIGERAVALAKGTEKQKVTDTLFAEATKSVIEEFKLMDSESRQVALALEKVGNQVGQIRIQPSQSQYRQGLASGMFTIDEKTGTAKFGKVEVARPKSTLTKSGLPQARPASNINLPGNYTSGRDLATQAAAQAALVANQSVLAMANAAGTNSPSKKTFIIGQDIARGLQLGMIDQVEETSLAASKLSAAATTLINPNTNKPFTQEELARATRVTAPQIGAMANNGGSKGGPVFLGMPGMPEPKEETQKRFGKVRGAIGRAGGNFGISALLFSLSMLPGKFGQLAQAIMPAVFALQAVGMLKNIIGVLPTILVATAAAVYQLNKSAKKAAEEIADSAKMEAEARYGSVKSLEDFAQFTGRALPSAREFSRNNRQLISASGEAVKRFAEFYNQKGNRATQVINTAAMKGPQAGMQAAAVDVAQRAAIFGLGPADIAANIKAAADLIGADQVKLKMAVQQILSPDGKDITKEPLTIKARLEFLKTQSNKNVQAVGTAISEVGKISIPKFGPLNLGTDYAGLKRTAGYQAARNKASEQGGVVGSTKAYGIDILTGTFGKRYQDQLNEFNNIQTKIQTASVVLSTAFTQQNEALALLNAQYADGVISQEEYNAQFTVSMSNFESLESSGKTLIAELNKLDSSGELAAAALKDLGNQALGALKKSNPELFKKITESLSKLDSAAQIDIYMAYAKGSLTILDLAMIPDILTKIDGKTARVALQIIAESNLSEGAKATLSVAELTTALNDVYKQLANPKIPARARAGLLAQRDSLVKDLAAARKAETDAAKVLQKNNLNTDKTTKTTTSAATAAGKLTDAYDKEIEALRKKRDALKDVNDEMDRQAQYQMRQMDLITQASKAKISGNFMEAAMLQQQSMFEGAKFTRESKVVQLDRLINLAEERKAIIEKNKKITSADQTFLSNMRSGNYQSLSPLPKTPTVGFNSGALGFSGSTTTIGGSMYTITMNISGNNPNEIADKVIAKIKLLENKNNKSNVVKK